MNQLTVVLATLSLVGQAALAQDMDVPDNLEELSSSTAPGVAEFTFVDQEGDHADEIRQILAEEITLPAGFAIELYAIVPDARSIAVGPQGLVTFVGTRRDTVWSVTDRNRDQTADEVRDFAPSLTFAIPNGPCFSEDGVLYIAEQNRVLFFPAAEFLYENPDIAAFNLIAQGDLIPVEEEAATTRPGSVGSGRMTGSTFRWVSPSMCIRPRRWTSTMSGGSAASSGSIVTAPVARSTPMESATRSGTTSIR